MYIKDKKGLSQIGVYPKDNFWDSGQTMMTKKDLESKLTNRSQNSNSNMKTKEDEKLNLGGLEQFARSAFFQKEAQVSKNVSNRNNKRYLRNF